MNKEKFKEALFAKDNSIISSIDIFSHEVSNDVEYFILANFFQSYLKGRDYIAKNFTQNLWKWISSDVNHLNQILLSDNSSLHVIFPRCPKSSNYYRIFSGENDGYLCERKFLTKSENIYRSILSGLGKHTYEQENWANEKGINNKSWIMSAKTKKYIASIKPQSLEVLKDKIFHFKYPKNIDRDANAVLKAVDDGISYPREDFGCPGCNVMDIDCDGEYLSYHFYEWLHHFNVKPEKFFSKEAYDMVSYKLPSYINKIKQIGPSLSCYSCKKMLVPNWTYAKKLGAKYNVTVFHCNDNNCTLFNNDYYLNHCLNFEYCNNLIDQRVNKNKCSNGLYVCNHDWSKKTGFYNETRGDCNSCCIEHSKTDKSSFQPKESSVLQF